MSKEAVLCILIKFVLSVPGWWVAVSCGVNMRSGCVMEQIRESDQFYYWSFSSNLVNNRHNVKLIIDFHHNGFFLGTILFAFESFDVTCLSSK